MSIGSYHSKWLDSGYQETLLPGSPWHEIKKAINILLAQEVKQLSVHTELTSHVIYLLGPRFVEEYLHSQDISMHSSPIVPNGDVHEQAKVWLNDKLDQIIRDTKLKSRSDADMEDGESLSPEALKYEVFGQNIVYRAMERTLSLVEKENGDVLHDNQCFADRSLITGPQSETLGSAVFCLLRKHPSFLKQVSQRLIGRQLPNSLRQLLWKTKIFNLEALPDDMSIDSRIEELRGQFMATVTWGEKELGIENATCSPVDGIIRHAVREIYDLAPCIQDGTMRKISAAMATEALNMLYVHGRVYEPHYALVLLPLIWTYSGYASNQDFLSQNLAEFLLFLLKNCFPSRYDIFTSADRVINRLQRDDAMLYNHMVTGMRRNVQFDPREFLVNSMHSERESALATGKGLEDHQGSSQQDDNPVSLLSHPIIFMRKWIGEGFVGVLDLPAVLFVWDQCFLGNWKPVILENVCLVILQLLRTKLLQADDYHGMKIILLNHPYRLYTRDIQEGFVYLCNGGSLQDVGSLRQPSELNVGIDSQHSVSRSSRTRSARPLSSSNHVELGELLVEKRLFDSPAAEISNFEPFDLYIDEVRFIPDNATVVKVTGRILNPLWKKPTSLDISDIEARAELESPARCPQFTFRYPVPCAADGIPHDSVLLLRVYTLDVDSGELVVIGNCALNLYKQVDNKYVLNVGGYQLRLKHQLPSTVSKLNQNLFTEMTAVPAVTLVVRILPHSEDFTKCPGYSSGFYDSSTFAPNESEQRLCRHYKTFEPYPTTVGEAIADIREEEQQTDETISDQSMKQWYHQRTSKQHLDKKPAKLLDLMNVVQYEQKQGLFYSVEQAFGLPNAPYVNVLAYVSEGPSSRIEGESPAGLGGEKSTLTNNRDFSSLQKSPRWVDQPKRIHPHADPLSSLVVQLFSLDAVYEPRTDRDGPGSVREQKGKTLTLVPQGWTVLNLFHKKYVSGGLYHLPLFEGRPSSSFMEFLSSNPSDISLHEAIRQQIHQLQGTSSVTIRLWDGHFSKDDCVPLPVKEDLLKLGNQSKIKKTTQVTSGKAISDLVLQSLTKQERKDGVNGQPFNKEKDHYQETMNMVFSDVLVNVLLEMGLAPL